MKSIYWILLGFVLLSVNFVWACPESEICVGDRVNFDGSKVGTIREIFSNGKVKISRDGHSGYLYRDLSQIGKGYRCVENLCAHDRVNFDGSKVGTVREIFSNGKVKISRDGHSGYSYRNLAQLGYEITCSSEIPCRCSN